MRSFHKMANLHIPKNSILTKNHFLFLHYYMILMENMHIIIEKNIT